MLCCVFVSVNLVFSRVEQNYLVECVHRCESVIRTCQNRWLNAKCQKRHIDNRVWLWCAHTETTIYLYCNKCAIVIRSRRFVKSTRVSINSNKYYEELNCFVSQYVCVRLVTVNFISIASCVFFFVSYLIPVGLTRATD